MWNKNKSLFLSRTLTYIGAVITLVVMVVTPDIASWYDTYIEPYGLIKGSIMVPFSLTIYFCGVMIIGITVSLYRLLTNIKNDRVFVKENTKCLRRISWECMLAGLALVIFGLWRYFFFGFAFAFVFMGLIMRVLKNVFEKAVEIKSENDFTI
ncbi:MAG: DUF2975 domain-containing protein [Ruminococcus sp.]|nr:DUF2975 domain-containing protein [Ruminococcus sp.]